MGEIGYVNSVMNPQAFADVKRSFCKTFCAITPSDKCAAKCQWAKITYNTCGEKRLSDFLKYVPVKKVRRKF